ncbi:MAG: GNAT family N-acetyltransferase [Terriglobia bacterium]
MLLRAFKPEDLETLYQIDSACFPPGVSYSMDELRAFITHHNSKTWVAVEDGKSAGFLIAQKAPYPSVHIITIDVTEEARRRGVGSALMDAAEEWAERQGAKQLALETAEDNHAAQSFYANRGYAKVDKLEGYYDNGAAAWVMIKRLP